MSDLGVIFCGKCKSPNVDSDFNTYSTLKYTDCGNEDAFKVGKVGINPKASISLDEIITMAKKEANI